MKTFPPHFCKSDKNKMGVAFRLSRKDLRYYRYHAYLQDSIIFMTDLHCLMNF